MDVCTYIDTLAREGPRMVTAIEAAGAAAEVPSCPEWRVRDLVRHTSGVHRWAARIVGDPRTAPWKDDLEVIAGGWPDDPDLASWFADGHDDLITVLRAADPGLTCWTFLAAASPLAMWARRQAHETTIHRADAELAAGRPVTPSEPEFAADGTAELLTCFITRQGGGLRSPVPRILRVGCDDSAGNWLVRIGPDAPVTVTGPDAAVQADCRVTGPAASVYLALWNRRTADDLTVEGDRTVLDLFRDRVRVHWT